jgi:DNA primase
MGTRIPEDVIGKIQKSANIVEVINEYVQLKKQGRNYFGLCPFHGEKTPSFSVSLDKQIFHCFGCKAGGNVFSFLMEIEGIPFLEAVKKLGDQANIPLPQISDSFQQDKNTEERQKMLEGHKLLAKLYHHCLQNTKQGEIAKKYLEQRGIGLELIEKFQLGYAPESWDFATQFLKKRDFSLELMAAAGILGKREFDGKFFDRFRDRIIFPIADTQGNVIGFGGRILGDGEPKYLNSPETKIFKKSRTLYGYHLSRQGIRRKNQIILFEGNVDVIAGWKAGIDNGVATLGTSLTDEHAKIISRNAESVIICFDADTAGIDAAFRTSEILENSGLFVRVAKMPDGMDPDDYINKYGTEKFRSDVIGASLTLMSFKLQYLRKGKNLSDEGERIQYIEEVIKVISGLPKAVERDHYLRQLSEEFNLSLDAVKQQQYQTYRQIQKKKDNDRPLWHNNSRNSSSILNKPLKTAFHNAERFLLAHMLKSIDITERVENTVGGAFNIEEYSAVAAYLYSYYKEGNSPDVSDFMQRINDSKLLKIVSELAMMDINSEVTDQELNDYINKVLEFPRLQEIQLKEKEKVTAEREKNFVLAAQIAKEVLEMRRAIKKKQ